MWESGKLSNRKRGVEKIKKKMVKEAARVNSSDPCKDLDMPNLQRYPSNFPSFVFWPRYQCL